MASSFAHHQSDYTASLNYYKPFKMFKTVLCCAILLLVDVNAFAKREAPAQPNLLADLQQNLDQFRHCVDQNLANMVGQVNEKQLQPVLNVVGDTLNRVSKAFDDLTATMKPAVQNEN